MGTLYDLLGALPDDDAEGLRVAFRRAAKATHPDTNPDNPDAALRFRQLVRAHNILSDAEQRATYDQLLAIATRPPPPPVPAARVAVYEKIHRGADRRLHRVQPHLEDIGDVGRHRQGRRKRACRDHRIPAATCDSPRRNT